MHKEIILRMVDQDKARYETLGDWFFDEAGNLIIQVTASDSIPNVPNDIFSPEAFLIALHELIEVMLCRSENITQKEVDDFDMNFNGEGEPGDHVSSPYRDQHRKAMIVEMLMANFLGLKGYGTVA